MTVEPIQRDLFDSRGIPATLDPHKFYEYRMAINAQSATGLEFLVYKIIPLEVIKSFAIAIDPFSQFKTAVTKIAAPSRTRYRAKASVFGEGSQIRYDLTGKNYGSSNEVNYLNLPGCIGPVFSGAPYVYKSGGLLARQSILTDYSFDSTDRTRPIGSDQGEFEFMNHILYSPPRYMSRDVYIREIYDDPNPYLFPRKNEGHELQQIVVGPSAAVFNEPWDQLKISEKLFASAFMAEKAVSMYKGTNPLFRDTSLFRNIVELRDLPRTVLSLRETLSNLVKLDATFSGSNKMRKLVNNLHTNVADIPKEYLSYHFGWKQMYKDLIDLLTTPDKVTKKINLLIKRNGMATTYRSNRHYVNSEDGVPGWFYESTGWEYDKELKTRLERSIDLRMVINTTFNFPTISAPQFNADLYRDKLGLYPRFTDLYNLVPWTWLVDWFTGFGNYLEIIEETSKDQSIINYGFLTYKCAGKVVSEYKSTTDNPQTDKFYTPNGSSSVTVQNRVKINHTSVCSYDFQLRKNLANVMDVKSVADPTSLNEYQRSILLALLADKSDIKRPYGIRRA